MILGGDKACLGGKGGVSGGKDIMLLGTLSWILSGEEVAYIKKKKKDVRALNTSDVVKN